MTGKLLDDIEVRDPPCKFCPHFQLCKDNRLACDQFFAYTEINHGNRGRPFEREPSREWYYRVFPNEDPERTEEVV